MKKALAVILLLCLAVGAYFYSQSQREGSPSYGFDKKFRGYSDYKDMTVYQSTVRGHSMDPTLTPGDNVYWAKAPIEEVMEGDIVIFNSPVDVKHETTVHRVIDVSYENSKVHLQTQGDNDPEPDEPITDRWYRGLVIGMDNC